MKCIHVCVSGRWGGVGTRTWLLQLFGHFKCIRKLCHPQRIMNYLEPLKRFHCLLSKRGLIDLLFIFQLSQLVFRSNNVVNCFLYKSLLSYLLKNTPRLLLLKLTPLENTLHFKITCADSTHVTTMF